MSSETFQQLLLRASTASHPGLKTMLENNAVLLTQWDLQSGFVAWQHVRKYTRQGTPFLGPQAAVHQVGSELGVELLAACLLLNAINLMSNCVQRTKIANGRTAPTSKSRVKKLGPDERCSTRIGFGTAYGVLPLLCALLV